MATVPDDYKLSATQKRDPVCWLQQAPAEALEMIAKLDLSDEVAEKYMGAGKSMRLKSFGHDDKGLHFLLTRQGTTVHTDMAYTRFSHHIILRNDGNRLRGLPRYDSEDPAKWHPMLVPGMMYALDTHSPHQGLADLRFNGRAESKGIKIVIAVDRDKMLNPFQCWGLFRRWLEQPVQIADVFFDPDRKTSLRWKENKAEA